MESNQGWATVFYLFLAVVVLAIATQEPLGTWIYDYQTLLGAAAALTAAAMTVSKLKEQIRAAEQQLHAAERQLHVVERQRLVSTLPHVAERLQNIRRCKEIIQNLYADIETAYWHGLYTQDIFDLRQNFNDPNSSTAVIDDESIRYVDSMNSHICSAQEKISDFKSAFDLLTRSSNMQRAYESFMRNVDLDIGYIGDFQKYSSGAILCKTTGDEDNLRFFLQKMKVSRRTPDDILCRDGFDLMKALFVHTESELQKIVDSILDEIEGE